MSGKAWTERLEHILERIAEVEKITGNGTEEKFYEDAVLIAAVERHIEIIGEITRHIPEDVKGKYSGIPWDRAIGMRNILAHGYELVLPDFLWYTATVSLQEMKPVIKAIKEEYKDV